MRIRLLSSLFATITLFSCSSGGSPNSSTTNGIAGAWFYLADTQDYYKIPDFWNQIPLNDVNVLYVGPGGIQANNQFGLYSSESTGALSNRFQWLITKARQDNPAVKIIISQWWGDGQGKWGTPLEALNSESAINEYANSVANFIDYYQTYEDGKYAIDGFDIDYESNNVIEQFPALANSIHKALQKLSDKYHKPFYFTISPADTEYLTTSSLSEVDYINMQSYAGGFDITPESYFALGVPASKILYGICPETNCGDTPTVNQALDTYHQYGMAGIHLWRLNSDNYKYEITVQQQIYTALNP